MPQVPLRAEIPETLAGVELPNWQGEDVTVGDLWNEERTVLVHLRHFGCLLCRLFVEELSAAYGSFRREGINLVAVGTGGRRYAREFVETRKIPFEVLVDKYLVTHDIIGVRSGHPLGILKPNVVASGIRAVANGQMQGKTGPHPFVFGAAHIIDPGGRLRYAWLNADYNDHPTVPGLLAAARG